MSIKTRVLAAAAAVTVAGTLALAGASAATAATPSCGGSCINTYPRIYAGQSLNAPQFVADVFRQGSKVGQPVILFRSSNTDPAEDWTITEQGKVSDFYAAGMVSAAFALHYGCHGSIAVQGAQVPCDQGAVDDNAWELQYAPFGVDSGLCMGLAATAVAGEKVSLQPCGVTARTVWAEDTNPNDQSPVTPGFYAAINGSDTNFSHPFVLTYPGNGYPTDKPRPELFVTNLAQFSQGPTFDDDYQLWTAFQGVLP